MKYLLIIFIATICSCKTTYVGTGMKLDVDLKKEINSGIVDGFYNNDTTLISDKTYLLK